jgi:hypothetical protein
MRMSRLMAIVACGALAITAMPVGPVLAATPSTRQCETAWYERQYASLAPGFPTSLSP